MIFLDRFDSTAELKDKQRTYKNIKKAVLEAGRFSCFDINTRKDGIIFTKLCKDPEIEVVEMQYPWTGIRKKNDELRQEIEAIAT